MKVVMDTAKKVVRLGRLKYLKEKTLAEIQSHINKAEQKMLDTIVSF
jgi:flagellar biosynthesis chaperone FliJ